MNNISIHIHLYKYISIYIFICICSSAPGRAGAWDPGQWTRASGSRSSGTRPVCKYCVRRQQWAIRIAMGTTHAKVNNNTDNPDNNIFICISSSEYYI